MNFQKFDMNLLVALDALLREKSVTRAANDLFLSQSAMSHSLNRLREVMGDPLLVRGPGGLTLTPLAEELREPVRQTLLATEQVLGKGHFDPSRTTHVFVLGTTDYFDSLLLPRVMERVRNEAQHARVLLRHVARERLKDELTRGSIDLAVSFVPKVATHATELFDETYSCIMRVKGRRPPRSITLDQYLRAHHILISPSGAFTGLVDDALADLQLTRNVVMSTPRYLSAAEAVACSDLLLTVQTRLARKFVEYLPVHMVALPLPVPAQPLVMQWSARTHGNPANAWLRKIIMEFGAG